MKIANLNNNEVNLSLLNKLEIKTLNEKRHDYTCPDCGQTLILKVGQKKKPHFAHKVKCECAPHTNESETHQVVKQLFYEWALSQKAQNVGSEVRLSSINRIADVYFEVNGQAYVFEIQKSQISEQELMTRTADYQQLGIQVFWIMIGAQKTKKVTQILNPLLVKNKAERLFYFDVETKRLIRYENLYYVTPKEVLKQGDSMVLKHLTLAQLLKNKIEIPIVSKQTWLGIKKKFRMQTWVFYMKSDPVLRRMCYEQRTTLSFVPSEVGWPIVNNIGFDKPLFVWQTYVLVGVVMSLKVGSCFTLSDVIKALKYRYKVPMNELRMKQICLEVSTYLGYLVMFKIIRKVGSYYEYVKRPEIFSALESALDYDEQLAKYMKKTLR